MLVKRERCGWIYFNERLHERKTGESKETGRSVGRASEGCYDRQYDSLFGSWIIIFPFGLRFKGKKIAIALVFREFFRGLNLTRGWKLRNQDIWWRFVVFGVARSNFGTIIRNSLDGGSLIWIESVIFQREDTSQEYTEFVYKLVRCSLLVGGRYSSSFSAGTKVS